MGTFPPPLFLFSTVLAPIKSGAYYANEIGPFVSCRHNAKRNRGTLQLIKKTRAIHAGLE